jgi:hypothetical protein
MIKNSIALLVALCAVIFTNAQTVIDCSSGRFDTEVFSAVTSSPNRVFGSNINSSGTQVQLSLDVFEPTGDTASMRPLIIWAHGGSFVTGTRQDADVVALSNSFAKRGYVCASIDYRLGIPFPPDQTGATQAVYRAVQDMKAAVRYFRQDAATTNAFKIDPNRIYVGGSSAGAFTALHLAYLDDVAELPVEIDTVALGNLEGNSGNPGYASTVSGVINLCGALGQRTYMQPGDEPLCSMHGTTDQTVPYGSAIIYLFNVYPLMNVDGSYSINEYADQIGVDNVMYTYYGAGHVPYLANAAYMDTTVRFVSNFLYEQLGCQPSDPNPLPNTFSSSTGMNSPVASVTLELFPNPSQSYCVIRSSEIIREIILRDITGRVVLKAVADSKEQLLNLEQLSDGIYTVEVMGNGFSASKKLSKYSK